jgi:NADH-quinone oxidoreductase subunit K
MTDLSLHHFVILSAMLFCIGIYGLIFNRKSIIGILIATEIMLLAANINFVAFSTEFNDITGSLFAIFILGVAAAELGIGLAILVIYFRSKGNISIKELNLINDTI